MGKLNLSRFYNKHFLVLAGNGFNAVIGILTSFILFHFLPMNDTGMWYVIQSFVALCEASRYGFLATATVKFYAGTDAKRGATVLGSVWYIAIILTLIVLIANAGALPLLHYTTDRETILCIQWVGITYLSSLPADVIFWKLQAEEKYGTMLWYRTVNSLSTIVAFVVLIVLHKMTLENALLWNFLTNVLSSLIGILFNMSGMKTIFSKSKECVLEIMHYGKYTFGTTSFSVLLGNADTWIINYLLGPAAVAIYNLSQRLMPIIELPLRSFTTTGMSEMAIAYNKKNIHQVTYIFKKYSGMLTIAFIPLTIGALIFSDIAINILGGAQYHGSIAPNLFRIFMVIALLYPIDRFNGLALDMTHKTKINFYKVILMLTVKVIVNFGGIYLFMNLFAVQFSGLYGITLSYLIVTLSAIVYGNYQLRKTLDYTIPGILSLGYSEMILFIRQNLKFKRQ